MKSITTLLLAAAVFLPGAYTSFNTNKQNVVHLSPPGDVVGKVTVGYQGWFSAKGDGSPLNAWGHDNLEQWPDVRQYKNTYAGVPFSQGKGVKTEPFYGNLGNGQPAKMFSSDDQQVADTHCLWMQQNGIDCIALQRFASYIKPGNENIRKFHDEVDLKMMKAAQKYGRKFYIMYDCGATSPVQDDWTNIIIKEQHLTSSPAYAHQNGKPVVCLWGVGKKGRGDNVQDWVNTINWFKAQGCYVIGGPLEGFINDVANQPAYTICDMIMPWMVGRTRSFDKLYTDDLAYCNAHGIDYQADIYPGTSFANTNGRKQNQIPRMHGDFMWQQFANAKKAGVTSVYISMFDEINEATGIFNCAEDTLSTPAGKYMLTLDADGTHVSSDFYLRLTNDGAKMIKGITEYQEKEPTPFELAPPAAIKLNVISGKSVKISWALAAGAPCYNIKRSTLTGGPYTTVAEEITGDNYTNTGLSANKKYYYVISSGRVNGGESVNSDPVSIENGKKR